MEGEKKNERTKKKGEKTTAHLDIYPPMSPPLSIHIILARQLSSPPSSSSPHPSPGLYIFHPFCLPPLLLVSLVQGTPSFLEAAAGPGSQMSLWHDSTTPPALSIRNLVVLDIAQFTFAFSIQSQRRVQFE